MFFVRLPALVDGEPGIRLVAGYLDGRNYLA